MAHLPKPNLSTARGRIWAVTYVLMGLFGVWFLVAWLGSGTDTPAPARSLPGVSSSGTLPARAPIRYDIQLNGREWVRIEHLIPGLWCYSLGGPDIKETRIRFADGGEKPARGKFGLSDPVSLALDRTGQGVVRLWVWPSSSPCP